jgi:regulator of sirC expression with transglutaminase-like and TPR domain
MAISPLDYFASLVRQDNTIPLFEAALTIAQDIEPSLDIEAQQIEVDLLAARLQRRLPADASDVHRLRMLNHFFYEELGFSGNINDYYATDNSYLHQVLHTRRGIPISLAIVYMELAEQIGIDIQGVSFPGHFLMKMSMQSGDVILDPFNGESLSRDELEERLEPFLQQEEFPVDILLAAYLQPAQPRDILVRMLRNLKLIYLERMQWQRLLEVQQRLIILLPNEISEKRDRGIAFANLDCPAAALADIEDYLSVRPFAPDAEALKSTLPELRDASKRLN